METTRKEIENLGLNKNTPFSEILLNGDRNLLNDLLEKCGWNGDNPKDSFDVKVVFNGVEVSIVDFNTIVESWWDRMYDDMANKLDYLKTEQAVLDKANELISDKMEILNDAVENFKGEKL